jgi:hypothetical protein
MYALYVLPAELNDDACYGIKVCMPTTCPSALIYHNKSQPSRHALLSRCQCGWESGHQSFTVQFPNACSPSKMNPCQQPSNIPTRWTRTHSR